VFLGESEEKGEEEGRRGEGKRGRVGDEGGCVNSLERERFELRSVEERGKGESSEGDDEGHGEKVDNGQ
jgi:hypothetical protein